MEIKPSVLQNPHRVIVRVSAPGAPDPEALREMAPDIVESFRERYLFVLAKAYALHCKIMIKEMNREDFSLCGVVIGMHAGDHEWALMLDARCPEERVEELQVVFARHLMRCWHTALSTAEFAV